MTRPTLLVTGASGFIGRALLEKIPTELDDSYRIVLLSSRENPEWATVPDGRGADHLYTFTAADFVKRGFPTVDFVIHLGSFTPKSASEADDVPRSLSNISNTRHLLLNLPNAPRRIVFASSIDVYGRADGPITEERSCEPSTLYGLSKLFCERMLTAMLKQPRYDETTLQIVRIGHTFGPGEQEYRKFIPETIRRLLAGSGPHFFTDGSEKRSFIHVSDCCRLILAALKSPADVGPINIASSTATELETVARHLCRIHRECRGETVQPTFEPEPRKGADAVIDTSKMEKHLGRPAISIEVGLRDEYSRMASLS